MVENNGEKPTNGLSLRRAEADLTVDQSDEALLVSLGEAAKKFNPAEATHGLQRAMLIPFVWSFIALNFIVLAVLIVVGVAEWNAIKEGREIERLVTTGIIQTVIAATTAQLGATIYLAAKGLFSTASRTNST